MSTADRVHRVDVAATPEAAWRAITDPDTVRTYYFGTAPRATWEVGAPIDYVDASGAVQLSGLVLECDEPRRLAHTFIVHWTDVPEDQGVLTWTLEPIDGGTRITLVHSGWRETGADAGIRSGNVHLVESVRDLLGAA